MKANPEEIREALGAFSDVFMHNLQEAKKQDLDPVESYEALMLAKICENQGLFKSRFIRGYFALTETLNKNHPQS